MNSQPHKAQNNEKRPHNASGKAKNAPRTAQKEEGKLIVGQISTIAKGAGFLDDPANEEQSIYIEPGLLNTALNKDTVEVRVTGTQKNKDGKNEKTGEVVRVISRERDSFVGVVGEDMGKVVIIPDDRKMYVKIDFAPGEMEKAKKDDKVYVKLLPWTDSKKNPQAKVLRVLGKKGVNDVEMESIVLEKGFEVGFPSAVEHEAEEMGKSGKVITAEEIAKRRDMRGTPTFTIDPFDAKDFDDAISFKQLTEEEVKSQKSTVDNQGPLYEIGVHIADVSHYVRPGTALDKEAVKRGCSIYLVDRTIPMLPEVLSNDVCSLNPQEDKLSFSAVFIVDEQAQIKDRWFGKTIMNSTHRFTYETAQAAIDDDASNMEKYSSGLQTAASAEAGMKYRDALVTLNRLAKIFQKEKFAKGAIEFESEEVKFRLDPAGKPVGVYVKPRLDTHKLVEEYMLLANREVARFVYDQISAKGKRNTGAIYRIHDTPDKDRIKDLAVFVRALGFDLKHKDGEVTAQDINRLLDAIDGTPQESLISIAVIRSMQKAVYSTANIGHFGLAFDFYTHFTSPIRRYPDLLVHRILEKHLNHEPFGDNDIVAFQKIAETSTDREIDAADAERSSKKLKQVEYMSTRVGQTFQGTISGVTKWGIYVEEKETRSEGMIGMRNIGNDFFVFDEKTYSIVGQKTSKRYTLGDTVTFKVLSADVEKKMLDFGLVG
ncbi:MAG: ribonuclease R [Candidatus Pacebacteria bacterium]|nr:ribonuclease R [Candidatus Paceibacterota bacterium]